MQLNWLHTYHVSLRWVLMTHLNPNMWNIQLQMDLFGWIIIIHTSLLDLYIIIYIVFFENLEELVFWSPQLMFFLGLTRLNQGKLNMCWISLYSFVNTNKSVNLLYRTNVHQLAIKDAPYSVFFFKMVTFWSNFHKRWFIIWECEIWKRLGPGTCLVNNIPSAFVPPRSKSCKYCYVERRILHLISPSICNRPGYNSVNS